MADLVARPDHAPGDDRVTILCAAAQTFLQRRYRGRQDENGDHQRAEIGIAELLCPLPVDIEKDIATALDCILDRCAWSAVGMAKDMGVFEHFPRRYHSVKLLLCNDLQTACRPGIRTVTFSVTMTRLFPFDLLRAEGTTCQRNAPRASIHEASDTGPTSEIMRT